jgi:hypothetical protein
MLSLRFPPRRISRKASGGVLLFLGEFGVPVEPGVKRVIAFVDGQNLFHAAKKAFGSRFPGYNPQTRASASSISVFPVGVPVQCLLDKVGAQTKIRLP